MRAFLDIFTFELRYHLKSPLFLGVLAVFFLLHLFTVTSTGINLGYSHIVYSGSPYLVIFTELVLGLVSLLLVVIFAIISMVRDHDYHTDEFFFTTPVSKTSFFLGRFAGSMLPLFLIALSGILGSLVGPFTPLADDPTGIGQFSLAPYLFTFFIISLPNFFIAGAFFFAIAAMTRSMAMTVAGVILAMAGGVWLNTVGGDLAERVALLDPFGALAFQEQIRYWTPTELNTRLPSGGLLFANRLLWLVLALAFLLFALSRFRTELNQSAFRWSFKRRQPKEQSPQAPPAIFAHRRVSYAGAASDVSENITIQPARRKQFFSQLRMDLLSVLKSPFFYILLLAAVNGAIGWYQGNVLNLAGMDLSLYPLTSNMLDFFHYGLGMYVMVIAIYYTGILMHRERDHKVNEITDALPFPDGIMVLAKIFTLCTVVTLFMLSAMATFITLQALAGYTNFEIGLYLQNIFIYDGAYYFMLCVLAVFIQVLAGNKWLGMLSTAVAFTTLTVLSVLGIEHLLVNFSLPHVTYSDMNGYGHFTTQMLSLITYWGAFCGLLLIAGHLLFPRGIAATVRERIADARSRMSGRVSGLALSFLLIFTGAGTWIFYNTNILNEYLTTADRNQKQADYEKTYREYENAPAPSFEHIDFSLDLYPAERSLVSSGSATLRNNKQQAIDKFVLSVDPRVTVDNLEVASATLSISAPAQGFYLFTLHTPLTPGDRVNMSWRTQRTNRGFVNSSPDNALVANGTNISNLYFMPIPGFNKDMLITDSRVRTEYGLPPKEQEAVLGDPEYLDEVVGGTGIDSRATIHAIISTAADQTAVTPGALQRTWTADGRNYFEYAVDRPIWPLLSINSARYAVARREWNGVDLAVYYHPAHTFNVEAMLDTAGQAMDYFNRRWGPYQFPWFHIVEYARYSRAAIPLAGMVPYSEAAGFIVDLSSFDHIDYTTIHELAHMWWGHRVIGANMQGRQLLNEGMAEYASLMFLREQFGEPIAHRILQGTNDAYLAARCDVDLAEVPLMYTTETRRHISYGKGQLVMYALTDILGEERINLALNNFLEKFSFKGAPFPTARDLVREIRAVAGADDQELITDLFEKIVLYDVQVTDASVRMVEGGYEVTLDINARQFEADGLGNEVEVPLHTPFDIVLFPDEAPAEPLWSLTPLYQEKHVLQSGSQTITITIAEKPGLAGVDPFRKMIDRIPENNIKKILNKSTGAAR